MTEKHLVYGLAFVVNDKPIIFYVGHTKDEARRRKEHMTNPFNEHHAEYATMKYKWCRSLKELGIEYDLFVINDCLETDEDSEYATILQVARDNQKNKHFFFDDLPLTNMKAGDFLSEMLADSTITTAEDIKQFKIKKTQAAQQAKSVNYTRGLPDESAGWKNNPKKAHVIDQAVILAEKQVVADYQVKARKLARELKHEQMLNDPERQRRIEAETMRLMLLDKTIAARENHIQILETGGYPSWTNFPDKLAKKVK